MIGWTEFIQCERGVLIAPAGHGKTTAIADCLLRCPKGSCQLILTHTHAGIASLRTKFRKKNVPTCRYQLETITGFAQRYVLSFWGVDVLPPEDAKDYFEVVIEKCSQLMQSYLVQNIIKASYDGVFVDEYQDCTIDQHNLIMELAHDLPLHLLGDPLQGIFTFENKPLVDFSKDLALFQHFNLLEYPLRWNNNNPALGIEILRIRKLLEEAKPIWLSSHPNSGFIVETWPTNEEKYRWLRRFINQHDSDSLLIICPSYKEHQHGRIMLRGTLSDRIALKQRIDYSNRFAIIDAIDGNNYYKCTKLIDEFILKCKQGRKIKRIAWFHDILCELHLNKTELNKWINRDQNSFVHRRGENEQIAITLSSVFSVFETDITLERLKAVIDYVVQLPNIKLYHGNLFYSIMKCFYLAIENGFTLFEAMKSYKSRLRHQGRRIEGRGIGTTLLTKGLEFDTVIVIDADKFEDEKNFYVAITRACKKLVLITTKDVISFSHTSSYTNE